MESPLFRLHSMNSTLPFLNAPTPASGSSPALAPSPSSGGAKKAEVPLAGRKLSKVLVPAAVILVSAAIAGGFYWHSRQTTDLRFGVPAFETAPEGRST